ncbi:MULTISPECIES: fibril protein [unclassified Myxococcus]|uniref:fibril protein n=1 Tax=unclassified Myxococcus TaxID=2648731 RepID=UPI0020C6DC57|nr:MULTISPECIES: fibril protein [unclassified Myxococcus]
MVSLRIACLGLLMALSACASSNPAVVRAPREEAPPVVGLQEEGGTYGYRAEDPVRVGWGNPGVMAFFELLRGPQGQRVAWKRLGPCCDTGPTPSLEYAGLEVFEVGYEGLELPVRLFIDPNHGAAIRAPRGFTIEGLTSRETPTTPSDVIEL